MATKNKYFNETEVLTGSYLPTELQAMLLLFNRSENLECAKAVVLKLTASLFYSGIHLKPLQLLKKKKKQKKKKAKIC